MDRFDLSPLFLDFLLICIPSTTQVHFNVFANAKTGHEWGMFTTDTDLAVVGPSYHEDLLENTRICANKVSTVGNSWDTVLVARLRFKPDSPEPTSL